MANVKDINIEVAYAKPDKQHLIKLVVPATCTVRGAIENSGIMDTCPEIDFQNIKVGIWNTTCELGSLLREGDRVEVYRPLEIDPKQARKLRADKNAKK